MTPKTPLINPQAFYTYPQEIGRGVLTTKAI